MVRIMIIEDDEEMRPLLKDFFKEEGFETDSVSKGVDALRLLCKDHFDLIISDVRMPGLTGLDILPRIRGLKPQDTYYRYNSLWKRRSAAQIPRERRDDLFRKTDPFEYIKNIDP